MGPLATPGPGAVLMGTQRLNYARHAKQVGQLGTVLYGAWPVPPPTLADLHPFFYMPPSPDAPRPSPVQLQLLSWTTGLLLST